MDPTHELSLRERKKERTRKAISDAATELFAQRGFDTVTIDEVAAAAEVSKKTVFNYFGCKEDLFFDEAEEAKARLLTAVRGREPGESVLAAVRRVALASIGRMCSGEQPWIETMGRLVDASPALRARQGEIFDEFAHILAEVIREEIGAGEDDVRPYVAGQAILAVQRSVLESARGRVVRGERGKRLATALQSEAERGYELLDAGMAALTPR
ncbi:MAG: TetR/AcrR family transcriptional regulator [Thermoleophilaceae bacterium]